jgi:hypothetical protein
VVACRVVVLCFMLVRCAERCSVVDIAMAAPAVQGVGDVSRPRCSSAQHPECHCTGARTKPRVTGLVRRERTGPCGVRDSRVRGGYSVEQATCGNWSFNSPHALVVLPEMCTGTTFTRSVVNLRAAVYAYGCLRTSGRTILKLGLSHRPDLISSTLAKRQSPGCVASARSSAHHRMS